MGTQINTRKIVQDAIDGIKPFQRGNIHASVYGNGHLVPKGRLPEFLADQLNARQSAVYVVFSYGTPIGWANAGIGDISPESRNWFIPDITYSITTTHHQSLLRVMVDNPGFYLKFGHYSPEDTIVAKALINEVMDEIEH